jgi:DNA-binding MarR family transcriptional regulator
MASICHTDNAMSPLTQRATESGDAVEDDRTRLLLYRVWCPENALSRMLDEALRPVGMSIAQCGVLFQLDLLGRLSAADLSRLMRITPQAIAWTVRRLVDAGWIDRRADPMHGRIVVLRLTDEGRCALRDAMKVVDGVESLVTSGVSTADRAALGRVLDHMQERARPGLVPDT